MSLKRRRQQNKSSSYEECFKHGIPIDKKYGSDFIDGFINKRYSYPPYTWHISQSLVDSKQTFKQNKSRKPARTYRKNITMKSRPKNIKSTLSRRPKSKTKKR